MEKRRTSNNNSFITTDINLHTNKYYKLKLMYHLNGFVMVIKLHVFIFI